ncbi:MAG: hypothetical protein LKG25_00555 [Prevotella sp.]|jgi:hypothetical protein|nr:hypothetical protein [Prevotella sp.]MCI1281067.1 hypothetical protein [Prevotella sp.]
MTEDNYTSYNSLSEIRIRKETLLKDIRKDDEQIRTKWNDLFRKSETPTAFRHSKRFGALLNTGAGLLDAAILGWKLYHKFSGNSFFGRRKRR